MIRYKNNHFALYLKICNTTLVYCIKLVDFIKRNIAEVKKIIYFSDGCTGQYKYYKNFVNLCCHKSDFELDAEWVFLATSLGKSLCDGVGVTVER